MTHQLIDLDSKCYCRIKFLFRLFLAILVLPGCSNDFDLFGENEDVPVICAMFNYHDTNNYIRISKTFQADEAISLRNNNFYNPDSVSLSMEIWENGSRIGNPIKCHYASQIKDTGFFQSLNSNLFSFRKTLIPQKEYRFLFKDLQTGKTATSRCIVPSLKILDAQFNEYYTSVHLNSLPNVYFYRTTCRFHYVEVTDHDTSFLWVDYPGTWSINPAKDSGRDITMPLVRIPYWEFLPEKIPVKEGVTRYALKYPIDYRILIGDEFLFDYLDNNKDGEREFNTLTVSSNISGGLGIFTAYDEKLLLKLPTLETFFDKLSDYPQMAKLNFKNYPWDL